MLQGNSTLDSSALVVGVVGVVGVGVGSALTLLGQYLHRRYLQRERVREAYARWVASIDMLTELAQAMILRREAGMNLQAGSDSDLMRRLEEDARRLAGELPRARNRESAAFGRLLLLDFGSQEIELANKIREQEAGRLVMEEDLGGRPASHSRFLEVGKEQAKQLGILTALVCRRFGRPR